MTEGWIYWPVIALLAVAGVVMYRVFRGRMTDLKHRFAEREAEHDRALADAHEQRRQERESTASHQQHELTTVTAEHQRRVQDILAERDAATAGEEACRKFLSKSLMWELGSRDIIVQVCEELGLHGFLATNVCIITRDADSQPFVTQIDHVLLTKQFAMIIENKGWAGLVFDGILPSSALPDFRGLVDEDDLDGSYAVQIRKSSATCLEVRQDTGMRTPRTQVRRHASTLRAALQRAGVDSPWLRTSVYYSHRDVTVYTAPNPPVADRDETPVVKGSQELKQFLAEVQQYERPRRGSTPVLAIGEELEAWGTDIWGFGAYEDRWRSLIQPPHRP